jgi:hypothetical protein
MTEISLLQSTLKSHLPWHGARLNFLAQLLIALFRVKTVNLAEIASAFIGQAQQDSHSKRLQRFFRHFEVDYTVVAKMVVALMNFTSQWVLCFDRTQWQFGQTTHNVLMLAVAHEGVAFPLLWVLLAKRGNSNSAEQIDLLRQLLKTFARQQIAYLTAEREFVGRTWVKYLLKQPVPFRIRIRQSDCLSNGRGQAIKARVLFADLPLEQMRVLPKRRRLWGDWVYVAALRLKDGQLLVVVTSNSPETAIAEYAKRWEIETLFGCLKRRGFCLESTHFIDAVRLSKLLAVLTLALCWAHRTGAWLAQLKPLKFKKHGRKAKSVFRYGFDHLRQIMLNLYQRQAEFRTVLDFLSCT